MFASIIATLLGLYFSAGELSSLTFGEAIAAALAALGTMPAEAIGTLIGALLPVILLVLVAVLILKRYAAPAAN